MSGSVSNLNNPLFGREAELRQLCELAGQAQQGSGRLVMISGDAGIGKSSLIREFSHQFVAEFDDQLFVLHGAAYDMGQLSPFAIWQTLFEDPRLTAETEPTPLLIQDDQVQIDDLMPADAFTRVNNYLRCLVSRRPVAIVLEDLHWADEQSLEILRLVGRRISRLPLLLVVSIRDRDLHADAPLAKIMPAIMSECQPYRIDLRPLDDFAIGRLVKSIYLLSADDEHRLQQFLTEHAEGNPLFVQELLRTFEQDGILFSSCDKWQLNEIPESVVPPLVRQVIANRLQRLDSKTRELLIRAATLGHSVPFHLWQALTGASVEEIETAIENGNQAGIIDRQLAGGDVRFSHALFREALYQEIPYSQLRETHQRIAKLLAAEPRTDPGQVAEQLRRGGDPKAFEWLMRAASQAQDRYLPQAALEYLRQAQDLAENHGVRYSARFYRLRAQACETLGAYNQARADLQLALAAAREIGGRHDEWRTLLDLGLLAAERDYVLAGQYFEQALDLARDIGDELLIAQSLNRVGNWYTNLDRPKDALAFHREALETFDRLGDSQGLAETYDLLGMTEQLYGDPRSSVASYLQSAALFRVIEDRRGMSSSLMTLMLNHGSYEFDTVFPDRTSPIDWWASAEEALQITREVSFKAGEVYALVNMALYLATRGEYGRALDRARAGYAIAQNIGHRQWLVNANWVLSRVAFDLLDFDLAWEHIQAARQEARDLGSIFWTRQTSSVLASIAIERNEVELAEQVLKEVLVDSLPESLAQRQTFAAAADLAIAQDNPERALKITDELIETAINLPAGSTIPRLGLLRGQALTDMGCNDAAEREWVAAHQSAKSMGYRPLLWRLDLRLAGLAGRTGSPATAQPRIDSAREQINNLATTLPEAKATAFLSHALEVVDKVEYSFVVASAHQRLLTDREHEVLELISEGSTDREIAEHLFISPRTVNNHVTNIFNKLNVSNRPAAVATAIRRNII